jgi:glycosyltransferase involved in cell wall biosynthesis
MTDAAASPVAVVEVELTEPLASVPTVNPAGRRYRGAHIVVRLHSRPLGVVDIAIGEGGVSPAGYATAIWSALGPAINRHLRDDGLPEVSQIGAEGISGSASPPCLRARAALLRDAPTASVIVCTRDRVELLRRNLGSLEALEYPNFEILVIDGSSTTQTERLVRDEFPAVRYLNVGNNGKCVALNRSLAVATGEVLAFTDDDVIVDRHWLAELVVGLYSGENVACATGGVVPLELETSAQQWFEESGAFTSGFERRVISLDAPSARGSLLPYATGRIGAGVSMAWRASVLRQLGGFDLALDTLTQPWPLRAPRHGTAGEDLAAFFDALVNGFAIVFEPGAIVHHEHRRSYADLERQLYWHGIGLGGYLTRCLVTRPSQIPHFLRRVPRGVFWGFASGSPRNRSKSRDFPRALTRAERRGVLHGPLAYFRGLPKARRLRAAERRLQVAAAGQTQNGAERGVVDDARGQLRDPAAHAPHDRTGAA